MDTLVRDLLEILECPVCFEYMKPPIMQCLEGHSVCNNCRERLTNCGICRERFTETRSLGLENVARKLKYPCKYKPAGCELMFSPDQMAAHQAECEYGHKCPFSLTSNKCEWKGSCKNMKEHVKTAHTEPGSTLETTGKHSSSYPDMKQNSEWYQVVIMQDELFLFFSKTSQDTLYSVLLYVRDKDKSKKFKCKLSFTTIDGSKEVTSTFVTPNYRRSIDDIFSEEDCMIVSYKLVKLCVNAKNELPYEINIFEIFCSPESRYLWLGNIARKLKYPCKNKSTGSEFTINPAQRRAHETVSEYGRKCPLSITGKKCEWKGSFSKMRTHIKTAHTGASREVTGKYSSLFPKMGQNKRWNQVIIMQDELFLFYSKTSQDTLFSVLLYVGNEDKSKKFRCKLSFSTTDGSKKVATTHITPSYCRDLQDIFSEEDCMVVSYKFVKRCINSENKLPFEVKIFEI